MKDDTGQNILTPELLLHAYSIGIFPMAEHRDDPDVFWVDPKRRGILPLHRFHISRSMRRALRDPGVSVTLNACFDRVVQACADRPDTWISAEISRLYSALHHRQRAQSFEVWKDGALIGGVYGVTLGSAFFGESMFSHDRNGSKIALACLTKHLRDCGFSLFDTQFVTPHLLTLGAKEISRALYQQMLERAVATPANIFAIPLCQPQEIVQRITQTS
ncbi:MAG: leucyl/phenylalanyl-tRNA--protein transferase [Paracoccaceae bacterium]